jgi:hypothetical protein
MAVALARVLQSDEGDRGEVQALLAKARSQSEPAALARR